MDFDTVLSQGEAGNAEPGGLRGRRVPTLETNLRTLSLKSPSVPDLHGRAAPGSPTSRDSLSVIDMYGFEAPAIMASPTLAPLPHEQLQPRSQSPQEISNAQNVDRYGFKKHSPFVSEQDHDIWWTEYSEYCLRRKHKWQVFLEKSGLPCNDDTPTRFPSRSEKLKRYVRKGIPAEWRGNAWWYFARGQEILNKNKNVYSSLLDRIDEAMKQSGQSTLPDLEIIERDLNRTFPDNIHFQKETFQTEEPPMIQSLRRVLVAFSIYNRKIGYCQSMNFLAGLLLLFMEEERAFWMLVIITSKYLPGVHNINLEGVNVDQGVLMLCVKEYLPEIWGYVCPQYRNDSNIIGSINDKLRGGPLYNNGVNNSKETTLKNDFLHKLPPITLCTASWFMGCFVGVLPIETTLRIWDCLFYEDSHFLFKSSLAILKLCEPELVKIANNNKHNSSSQPNYYTFNSNTRSSYASDENDMEVFQVVQSFPKKLLNPNELFDRIIFKKKFSLNKLNQEDIDRCRRYVTTQRVKFKRYNEIVGSNDEAIANIKESSLPLLMRSPLSSVNNINLESDNHSAVDNYVIENSVIGTEAIDDTISSEVNGFKKTLTGVHWNNSIKEKVKLMRRRKTKEEFQT